MVYTATAWSEPCLPFGGLFLPHLAHFPLHFPKSYEASCLRYLVILSTAFPSSVLSPFLEWLDTSPSLHFSTSGASARPPRFGGNHPFQHVFRMFIHPFVCLRRLSILQLATHLFLLSSPLSLSPPFQLSRDVLTFPSFLSMYILRRPLYSYSRVKTTMSSHTTLSTTRPTGTYGDFISDERLTAIFIVRTTDDVIQIKFHAEHDPDFTSEKL